MTEHSKFLDIHSQANIFPVFLVFTFGFGAIAISHLTQHFLIFFDWSFGDDLPGI